MGHEAGGHGGHIGTLALVPQVVNAVKPLPTLDGSGTTDRRGVVAVLVWGAVGVWIGARFMAGGNPQRHGWRSSRLMPQTSTVKNKLLTG